MAILIILGGPNSPTGELSSVSKERISFCIDNYRKGDFILCTGGWGVHFNTFEKAHASLLKDELIINGISEDVILDFALSSNTVEDAVKSKVILSNIESSSLTIITSDYHVNRVKLIFEIILNTYQMKFIGVKSNLETKELKTRMLHEKKAIDGILKNGLYY